MSAEGIVATGTRYVTEVRSINRELLEKTLRMRCLAYLSQVKADLLTDTIFSIQEGKDVLKRELARRAQTDRQLRSHRDHLESLVAGRTSELTRANRRLELEIAERTHAEQERRRLETQLWNARNMEALGRLASGIAHDFNNVLTGILGYAELAQEDLPEQSAARFDLDEVLHGVLRARSLVAQILAFSRQSGGEPQPLALGSIVREASRLVRAGLGSAVEVRVEVADDTPMVRADSTQMHQVMINLCTNAGQAMPEGGLLEVRVGALELDEHSCASRPELSPGRFACLVVRDTGCGMPPEVLERIFEPYFTTREASGGTGLGLALVHGIVSELGGSLTIRSEENRGTEIEVVLPAVEASEAAAVEALEEAPTRGHETILFVDDEVQVRALMQRGLERHGYSVTVCADGAEALACIRPDPARFDLIITDLTMPGMSGIELARSLRQIGVSAPIMLYTGFARETTREAARAVGVQALVSKPLGTRELAREARRLLDEAAALH